MPSVSFLKRSLWSGLNGLFSSPCALCDRLTSQPFCLDCARQLNDHCRPVSQGSLQDAVGLPVAAMGAYSGTLKQALSVLKYGGNADVGYALGQALGQWWQSEHAPDWRPLPSERAHWQVLAIPLHAERQRQRGYNQAELLAERFCQTTGLNHVPSGLMRVKATAPLHGLNPEDRRMTLTSAFAPGRRLHRLIARSHDPIQILLIDDIYTTGATVRSAAATLKSVGITVGGVVTVARTYSSI